MLQHQILIGYKRNILKYAVFNTKHHFQDGIGCILNTCSKKEDQKQGLVLLVWQQRVMPTCCLKPFISNSPFSTDTVSWTWVMLLSHADKRRKEKRKAMIYSYSLSWTKCADRIIVCSTPEMWLNRWRKTINFSFMLPTNATKLECKAHYPARQNNLIVYICITPMVLFFFVVVSRATSSNYKPGISPESEPKNTFRCGRAFL